MAAYVLRIEKEAVRACNILCEQNAQAPKNFLSRLGELTSDRTVIDQLLSVILACRDTTAGLLSVMFHVVARRLDV
ncbi:hypothetical protein AnigIFM62618_007865 [Aspergillus niger]|nr:hypothetical protein AnigIFM62618_007865 [Aspergillus niger]